MSFPRLVALAAAVLIVAACPNPRNPLGPPITPPNGGGAGIAFRLGGTGTDLVRAVATDATGDLFIAGEFTASADFDPSTATRFLTSFGGADVFVARYTATGALVWVSQVAATADVAINALALDPAGNVVVGGSFAGTVTFEAPGGGALTSNGGRDAFLAVYSAAGTLHWARGFGGPGDEAVLGVTTQSDGTIYAAGSFAGTVTVDPDQQIAITSAGGVDGFLASWTGAGETRWAFSVGGPDTDLAPAVAAGPAGSVYLGGSFGATADFGPGTTVAPLTSLGGRDLFLARYTAAGVLVWVRGVGGAGDLDLSPGGLAVAPDGAVFATGSFTGVADFDLAGAGGASRTSEGARDLFVARYGTDGQFDWVTAAGGLGDDLGHAVAAAPNGDVVVTGSFTGTARFDPGTGATALTALGTAGASDIFIARYSASGGFRWAIGIGAPLVGETFASAGLGVAVDGAGRTVVGGRFFGAVDVDPSDGLAVLTSLGGADGVVAKYTAAGTLAPVP